MAGESSQAARSLPAGSRQDAPAASAPVGADSFGDVSRLKGELTQSGDISPASLGTGMLNVSGLYCIALASR